MYSPVRIVLLSVFFLALAAWPVAANVSGPIDLPAGASLTVTDTLATDGKLTLTYTGLNPGQYDQLWWAPVEIYADLDANYDPPSSRPEILNPAYQGGGVWQGRSWAKPKPSSPVFKDCFTRVTVSGISLTDPAGSGESFPAGIDAISAVTADSFTVEVLFEAQVPGTSGYYNWMPVPDALAQLAADMNVTDPVTADLRFSGGFFYTAVPAPGAALLGGIGTLLIGWLRRRAF